MFVLPEDLGGDDAADEETLNALRGERKKGLAEMMRTENKGR